jgi:hypothetical protein
MLVSLSEETSVNPDQVVSLRVHRGYGDCVIVTLTSGETFNIPPRHGELVWETEKRLRNLINGVAG